MSDSDKTKEQLIEELKALRSQNAAGTNQGSANPAANTSLTRRDVLTGWVAPVILTVPLIPRSGLAAAEGGGNGTGADFTAFPTKLDIQADGPAGVPSTATVSPTFSTFSPTAFNTPSTLAPTQAATQAPTMRPTMSPTQPPTQAPTSSPTSSPTISIPVELTEFEVNG